MYLVRSQKIWREAGVELEAAEAENLEGVGDGDRHKLILADSLRHSLPQINRVDFLPKQSDRHPGGEGDVGCVQEAAAAEELRRPQQLDPPLRQPQ